MARTKGVNKSQAVREFLTTNPNAKAKEVVEALAKNGVKVNDGLVYAVKGAMKEKKKRKARMVKAAKAAANKASSNGTVSKPDAITMIREVNALAEKAGGYEKLKELVDALSE
jgi:arginine repressor